MGAALPVGPEGKVRNGHRSHYSGSVFSADPAPFWEFPLSFGSRRGFHSGLESFPSEEYSRRRLTGKSTMPGTPRALMRA